MLKLAVISGLLVILALFVLPAYAEVISFETDKKSYVKGENIRFSGILRGKDVSTGASVTLVIADPNGKFVLVTQTSPDKTGSFQTMIDTQSRFLVNGTYHATAYTSSEDQSMSTSFDFSIGSNSGKVTLSPSSIITKQQITLLGNNIFLSVTSSSKISDFVFEEATKQISFKVTGNDGTNGATIIPIGQVMQGPYRVTLDGKDWRDFEIYKDKVTGDDFMRIRYQHTTHEITITGTVVVPEFSTTVALVLAVSIIFIIVFGVSARKYGTPSFTGR